MERGFGLSINSAKPQGEAGLMSSSVVRWAVAAVCMLGSTCTVQGFIPSTRSPHGPAARREPSVSFGIRALPRPRRAVLQAEGTGLSDLLGDLEMPVAAPPAVPVIGGNDQAKYFLRCGRCNAAYEVPSDIVGSEGARVKCEVCGHTWYQASNRLQILTPGYVLKEYPQDLRDRVADNLKNNRHPLDDRGAKGEISVFVGNLPFSLSEDGIRELFGAFGPVVTVTIVKDSMDRSKGFGFVEMSVKEDGEAAIAALDGKEVDGRQINVRLGTSKAQPKMRRDRTTDRTPYQKKEYPDRNKEGGAGGSPLSSIFSDDD